MPPLPIEQTMSDVYITIALPGNISLLVSNSLQTCEYYKYKIVLTEYICRLKILLSASKND